jgi:hypothetical protein
VINLFGRARHPCQCPQLREMHRYSRRKESRNTGVSRSKRPDDFPPAQASRQLTRQADTKMEDAPSAQQMRSGRHVLQPWVTEAAGSPLSH